MRLRTADLGLVEEVMGAMNGRDFSRNYALAKKSW
jgi:hypothetical protein